MTGKKTTLLIAAALAVCLFGAAALYGSLAEKEDFLPPASSTAEKEDFLSPASSATEKEAASSEAQEESAAAAPDFTMLDSEGNTVALSERLGAPTVLNFWASWCGPCKNEMPAFDAMAAELAGEVNFMMVNLTDGKSETVERAKAFLEEQGYGFPVFFDTNAEGAKAYAVRSIPVTYFIDADGVVQAYAAGSIEEETLRQGIDLIRN